MNSDTRQVLEKLRDYYWTMLSNIVVNNDTIRMNSVYVRDWLQVVRTIDEMLTEKAK